MFISILQKDNFIEIEFQKTEKENINYEIEKKVIIESNNENEMEKNNETKNDEKYKQKFISPISIFNLHNKKRINCLSISKGGQLGLSGSDDGSLRLWTTDNGTLRVIFKLINLERIGRS
jgi:WD40 repeat protein